MVDRQQVEPQLGDFALSKVSGIAGIGIRIGQWLNGDAAPVQHAYIYVGDGQIVQATPDGAELIPIEEATPPVRWSTGRIPLSPTTRVVIASEARKLVGTPYSFLDYVSIALARFRIRPRWVWRYVADTGHMICSQLVDEAYLRAGAQLFDDGRIPGDVTPGDLWWLLQEKCVTSTDRDLRRLARG
ncbi:hypothetical protein AB0A77_02020 [Streptomyces varsoviensis]|uniref:hypothetical protein n=1 Tax=Streptomyces varsoviensis TaxID=67373 RepID=UPI0033EEEE94